MLETENKTKILARVWPNAAAAINRKARELNLKRDSYLNDLFAGEIGHLEKEIGFQTPDDARGQIKQRLRDLEPKPMTIVLDRSLVARMQEVLAEKNISRNSFINRVLFFLVAKADHLDRLGIKYLKSTYSLVKPLEEAGSTLYDPFYNIRNANDDRFYSLVIPFEPIAKNWPTLFGLNCAIADDIWQTMKAPSANLIDLL